LHAILLARAEFLRTSSAAALLLGLLCWLTMAQPIPAINERVPEDYDLTLLHPDGKLGRDIAIMRTDIEELHAKLAWMPAAIARAVLGIIFCTSVITTLLGWWFLAR